MLGFIVVPDFPRYLINTHGEVYDQQEKEFVKVTRFPSGYWYLHLWRDCKKHMFGRHQLLARAYKHPGPDVDSLIVNHINGIKGDDALKNLEWTTYQGNAEHAGALGLTEKCMPLAMRDVDTGEITKYPSLIACARAQGISKDSIVWRVQIGETRVFPERKQYRLGHSDEPWLVPDNIELALLENSTSKHALMKEVLTGEVYRFERLGALANHLKVSASTITGWLALTGQPVLPGLVQLKWIDDTTPWREVIDPTQELDDHTGFRSVVATNEQTGEKFVYHSAVECARARSLRPTALNYRLKSKGTKVFEDGYRYCYYSDIPRSH